MFRCFWPRALRACVACVRCVRVLRVPIMQGILDAVKTTNFHIVPSLHVHRAWYNCVFEIEALRLSCVARQVVKASPVSSLLLFVLLFSLAAPCKASTTLGRELTTTRVRRKGDSSFVRLMFAFVRCFVFFFAFGVLCAGNMCLQLSGERARAAPVRPAPSPLGGAGHTRHRSGGGTRASVCIRTVSPD